MHTLWLLLRYRFYVLLTIEDFRDCSFLHASPWANNVNTRQHECAFRIQISRQKWTASVMKLLPCINLKQPWRVLNRGWRWLMREVMHYTDQLIKLLSDSNYHVGLFSYNCWAIISHIETVHAFVRVGFLKHWFRWFPHDILIMFVLDALLYVFVE